MIAASHRLGMRQGGHREPGVRAGRQRQVQRHALRRRRELADAFATRVGPEQDVGCPGNTDEGAIARAFTRPELVAACLRSSWPNGPVLKPTRVSAIIANAPTQSLRLASVILLGLMLGCDEASMSAESGDGSSIIDEAGLAEAPASSRIDGGASTNNDASIDAGAFAGPLDSSAQDSSVPLGASTHVADGGFSPCSIFSPIVDAEVPVFLSEPLSTDCASRSDSGAPTKGPIPPEANNPGGKGINWALTPDFIAVASNSGGVAGYVSKYDLFCNVCGGAKPVLDDTLQHVIGYAVPGRGFVPSTTDAGT